jgi:hypothetical protein
MGQAGDTICEAGNKRDNFSNFIGFIFKAAGRHGAGRAKSGVNFDSDWAIA